MSHELRTPLNSLLILSDQLSKNHEGNLTGKQLEFAKTIHSSGNDLLMLINDILDLSKIESGTVVVDAGDLRLDDLKGYVERTFRHVAESKSLAFHTRFDPKLPWAIYTDAKRLQQIIKNLLSNAFKFTHQGQVTLTVEPADGGWTTDNEDLNRADGVIRFAVSDTGIGIPPDKQLIIFGRSSRPTGPPAGSTAGPGWAWRSAASCRGCWGARSGSPPAPAGGAPSTCTCRSPTTRRGRPGSRRSLRRRTRAGGRRRSANPNPPQIRIPPSSSPPRRRPGRSPTSTATTGTTSAAATAWS
jgi:hypothetical protein